MTTLDFVWFGSSCLKRFKRFKAHDCAEFKVLGSKLHRVTTCLPRLQLVIPSIVPQAVQACHELLLWVIPQLDKFPRSRRFTLGERVESGIIEVLELLAQAEARCR